MSGSDGNSDVEMQPEVEDDAEVDNQTKLTDEKALLRTVVSQLNSDNDGPPAKLPKVRAFSLDPPHSDGHQWVQHAGHAEARCCL